MRSTVAPSLRPRSKAAAATRPTASTTQRSHGFHSGDLAKMMKAQPVVTRETAASVGRAQRSALRVHRSQEPMPTSAPIDGARATV